MAAPAIDAPDALSHLIPSRVARGFFLAIVAGLFFNFLNGAVKELATDMPPLYVAWGRWIAGIALVAPYLWWRVGIDGMRTHDMKLHCLRGLFHQRVRHVAAAMKEGCNGRVPILHDMLKQPMQGWNISDFFNPQQPMQPFGLELMDR